MGMEYLSVRADLINVYNKLEVPVRDFLIRLLAVLAWSYPRIAYHFESILYPP